MNRYVLNSIVIAGILGAGVLAVTMSTHWKAKKQLEYVEELEECYGIARAGKNDCATSKHSCASQSTKNRDPNDFIVMPKGLCDRIAGGKLR